MNHLGGAVQCSHHNVTVRGAVTLITRRGRWPSKRHFEWHPFSVDYVEFAVIFGKQLCDDRMSSVQHKSMKNMLANVTPPPPHTHKYIEYICLFVFFCRILDFIRFIGWPQLGSHWRSQGSFGKTPTYRSEFIWTSEGDQVRWRLVWEGEGGGCFGRFGSRFERVQGRR